MASRSIFRTAGIDGRYCAGAGVGTAFVGRTAELAAAEAGSGRLVLIAGEPGIGKTRLDRADAARADADRADADPAGPVRLAAVADRIPAEVLAALDEAERVGLVAGIARWDFGPDLIRETARLDLAAPDRLAAHDRYAATRSRAG